MNMISESVHRIASAIVHIIYSKTRSEVKLPTLQQASKFNSSKLSRQGMLSDDALRRMETYRKGPCTSHRDPQSSSHWCTLDSLEEDMKIIAYIERGKKKKRIPFTSTYE